MIFPGSFEFAYVPNWYEHLLTLTNLALPEPWRVTRPLSLPKNTDTPILEKYVTYVSKKQVIDFNNFQYESDPEYADKIFYLRDEKVCFHTGLYTKNYKSICGWRKRRQSVRSTRLYPQVYSVEDGA